MSRGDELKEYRAKRKLSRSGEPAGGEPAPGARRFVIQRHDASSPHFDFRLQVGSVLASWAVPKGPSTDPREKRLAVRTEDHPLDYAGFEGRIPPGEYGAGTVIVWDEGEYENRTGEDDDAPVPMDEALEDGHVVVELKGHKLTGSFALTRTGDDDDDDGERWILVKLDDEGADARRKPAKTQPESVLSGRVNEDLEQ
ncbi:DNA polymerase ligase N-terminal domain-containing protein [Glycomyces terrestris]|uniref:DNA ligase n=1 Tax=Glycomyces terrestris TaxID=2493553 RepID=A0A426UT60_9ACTN|nr:DNA polymerase ligase N-terminal domain-containing protein [Glycomyces terrestris]RRR96878.1 DNA ligase [Glycomyces terrestris]